MNDEQRWQQKREEFREGDRKATRNALIFAGIAVATESWLKSKSEEARERREQEKQSEPESFLDRERRRQAEENSKKAEQPVEPIDWFSGVYLFLIFPLMFMFAVFVALAAPAVVALSAIAFFAYYYGTGEITEHPLWARFIYKAWLIPTTPIGIFVIIGFLLGGAA